jgi:hypothetical protein
VVGVSLDEAQGYTPDFQAHPDHDHAALGGHDTTAAPAPDSTDAWMTAGRAHLERLIASADDTDQAAPKRRRWQLAPLPWLVVRQYHHAEHVVCAHRWEWVAEACTTRRERRHRSEWGVFYTARHRTEIRKTGAGR